MVAKNMKVFKHFLTQKMTTKNIGSHFEFEFGNPNTKKEEVKLSAQDIISK